MLWHRSLEGLFFPEANGTPKSAVLPLTLKMKPIFLSSSCAALANIGSDDVITALGDKVSRMVLTDSPNCLKHLMIRFFKGLLNLPTKCIVVSSTKSTKVSFSMIFV